MQSLHRGRGEPDALSGNVKEVKPGEFIADNAIVPSGAKVRSLDWVRVCDQFHEVRGFIAREGLFTVCVVREHAVVGRCDACVFVRAATRSAAEIPLCDIVVATAWRQDTAELWTIIP